MSDRINIAHGKLRKLRQLPRTKPWTFWAIVVTVVAFAVAGFFVPNLGAGLLVLAGIGGTLGVLIFLVFKIMDEWMN